MLAYSNRYNDYYLLNDMEMDGDGSNEPEKYSTRKRLLILLIIFICFLVLIFTIVFVIFPLAFMFSVDLQRMLIFTHFDLPNSKEYFEEYRLPGYKNKYVTVQDLDTNTNKSLGIWQMLPVELTYRALHDPEFDYEEALLNSDYSVLIYFHGTGEARSDNTRKYQLLRQYFHIIAFDYRSYADSSKGALSEKAVVNDCIQLYEWVKNKTKAAIFVWGHSLGSALATSTVMALEELNVYSHALILESAFTSMRDELYVHPYGKIFAWLPWFKATVLNPLYKNGFIFDTAREIVNVSCPIMILHAEDDDIVPYRFGKKLYQIASNRSDDRNVTIYYQFEKDLGYKHYFIYQDPFLKYYIMDFIFYTNSWLNRV